MHLSKAHLCTLMAMREIPMPTNHGHIARVSGYAMKTTWGCLQDLKAAGIVAKKRGWWELTDGAEMIGLQPHLSVCDALSKKGKRCTHEPLPGEPFCERHTGKQSGAIRQSSVFRPANRRIL